MKEDKIQYIEYLRAISCIAVIAIHVLMALPNNHSIEELGIAPYALMNSAHMLVNLAVPVFFMISGMLLIPKCVTYKRW